MEEVTYEQGRERMQDGDIIFVRESTTFTSKMIRFFTRSEYSHVGVVFWATIGGQRRVFVVEAQGGTRRRIVNLGFYSSHSIDVVTSPRPWDEYASEALESIGVQDYGWIEAAYVGLRDFVLHQFNYVLPSKDLPGEICSEFVARLLQLPDPHLSPEGLRRALGGECKLRIQKQKGPLSRALMRVTTTLLD